MRSKKRSGPYFALHIWGQTEGTPFSEDLWTDMKRVRVQQLILIVYSYKYECLDNVVDFLTESGPMDHGRCISIGGARWERPIT